MYLLARTNSFLAFAHEQRGIIKQQQPDITFDELHNLLSSKWKELPDNEKKVSIILHNISLTLTCH